jgi:hypothetical protein
MSLFIVLDDIQPSLPALADLCRTSDAMTEATDKMVAQLREEGCTWRVLAEASGMTENGLVARQRRLAARLGGEASE